MMRCSDGFVAIATQDLSRLAQFYQTLFETVPTIYQPERYAEFTLPGFRLGIFVPKPNHQAEFADSAGSPMSLCLEVEHLDEAIAHVTALGYPPTQAAMQTSHGAEIYVYDPEGNRLILHQGKASPDQKSAIA